MAEIAMKRVLLLFDSDPIPNSFDIIVGYDGGVDHIRELQRDDGWQGRPFDRWCTD